MSQNAPVAPHAARPHRSGPLIPIDAGWLFVIAGLGILASTVLIPAIDDLEEARWQRDRAIAIERHRLERLERYGAYLDAVMQAEESVVLSLAAEQLNRVPAGSRPLIPVSDPARRSASVFPALEPAPLKVPPRVKPDSLLSRLATGESSRLAMLVVGAMCVLVGVLPPASRPARRG